MNKNLRFAIYTRKSTEGEDRQVQSIDAQLHELRKIAQQEGLKVVKTFEESKSAKTPFKRPQFAELLKMVNDGKINGILCWQLNRLSRNPTESGMLQQALQDEKLLKIQTFDKTYNPEDNAVIFSVESSISNQFIIDLRKNVKRGIREKARNGGISGPAPEGYQNNRADKTIEIDPLRFPLIRRAFDLYLTGNYAVTEVKQMLDEAGYLTTKHPHNGNKPISRSALYNIFANPRYAGLIPDPYEEGVVHKANFPPMITPDEFEHAQRLLGRKGRTRYVSKKQFELKGLLKCGDCGGSITAERKSKNLVNGGINYYTYYRCTHRKPCSQKGVVREDELFKQLDKLLDYFEITPQLYEWGLAAIKEIAQEEIDKRDDTLKMQFENTSDIQNKLDRLLNLVTDGVISSYEYQQKTESLKKELAKRHDEQQEAARRARNWYEIIGETLKQLNNATEQFRDGDFSKRRDILLAIGYNPILINNEIRITPNSWLIPIKNELPKIKMRLQDVITKPPQIRKASEEAILSSWYPGQDLNL